MLVLSNGNVRQLNVQAAQDYLLAQPILIMACFYMHC